MRAFGASAPLKELQKKFGFHPDRVVEYANDNAWNGVRPPLTPLAPSDGEKLGSAMMHLGFEMPGVRDG